MDSFSLDTRRDSGMWGGLGSTVRAGLTFGSQLTPELQPGAPALGSSNLLRPSLSGSHYIPKRN